MPLSNEPDPYSMEHYNTKFQVMLGRQAHNARQVMKHALRTGGRFQNMYRTPLERNKIKEILKKTGYVEHGGQHVKKSYATKARKEAARELRRRQGKPVVGGRFASEATLKLLSLFYERHPPPTDDQIRRLMDAGADVTGIPWQGEDEYDPPQPLIFHALDLELWKILAVMIDRSANAALAKFHGETIFHRAAARQRMPRRIVEKLIAKGADVNALDVDGFTPLYRALRQDNAYMVSMFLQMGANPRLVNLDRVRGYAAPETINMVRSAI